MWCIINTLVHVALTSVSCMNSACTICILYTSCIQAATISATFEHVESTSCLFYMPDIVSYMCKTTECFCHNHLYVISIIHVPVGMLTVQNSIDIKFTAAITIIIITNYNNNYHYELN